MMRTASLTSCLVALLSVQLDACQGGSDNTCNCGASGGGATIRLPCGTTEPPTVKVTGGCTTAQNGPETMLVESTDAGTCSLMLTFASGATSSVDISFTSIWLPCGSDPKGCGQGLVGTPSVVPLGKQCVDSGADAGASD
jgi:hypothetical protein